MNTIKFSTISKPNTIFFNNRFYSLEEWNKALLKLGGNGVNLYPPGSGEILINNWHVPLYNIGTVKLNHASEGYVEVEPSSLENFDLLIDAFEKEFKLGVIMRVRCDNYMQTMKRKVICFSDLDIVGYELVSQTVLARYGL